MSRRRRHKAKQQHNPPRGRGQAINGSRPHPQKPPDCCRTHAACSSRQGSPCWSCSTLAAADTVLGLAVLHGYGQRTFGDQPGPVPSVLECLLAAEEEIFRRRIMH